MKYRKHGSRPLLSVLAGTTTGLALFAAALLWMGPSEERADQESGTQGKVAALIESPSPIALDFAPEDSVQDGGDAIRGGYGLEQEEDLPAIQDSSQDSEDASGQPPSGPAEMSPETWQELSVHFLDVGQGDSTLLLCGGEAMLIDAGDNSQGTHVQNYLRKQGVETLKYVVCTHPDEDHIGGMDVILYKFDCGTIFMTEEEKDTNTYRDVIDVMGQKGYARTLPVPGQTYRLGDAVFTILGPADMGSDSNDNSISLYLSHGDDTFLFTGDAGEEEEARLLEAGFSLDADVYKTGHHGSRTSSSQELLDAVSPAYAVISCGEGNSYGHPHGEVLNRFRAMGVSVYRTDEQGSIVADSNGRGIAWNCSPSETWQAGEPTGSSAGSGTAAGQDTQDNAIPADPSESAETSADSADPSGTPAYICNLNSHIFHYPDCRSVKLMSESNKLPSNQTREEVIGQEYRPCKNCHP